MAKEDYSENQILDIVLKFLKPMQGINHGNLKSDLNTHRGIDLDKAEYDSLIRKLLDDHYIYIKNENGEDRYFISFEGKRLLNNWGYSFKHRFEKTKYVAIYANAILATLGTILGIMVASQELKCNNSKSKEECTQKAESNKINCDKLYHHKNDTIKK